MILLAGFLDVLFRAFVLIGLTLSVGGIVFHYIVLKPSAVDNTAQRRNASLIALGAFALAAFQLSAVIVTASTLANTAGGWSLADFLGTHFARAGTIHAVFGLLLGCASLYLRRRVSSAIAWAMAALLAALVLASGAWLVHGASRLENAPALMAVTMIHQLAASIWVGGLMHLAAQWRILVHSPDRREIWPRLLARFSPMALGAVVVLVAAGMYLYQQYVYSIKGLVGTAYGMMLLTKIALMGVLLLLGGINNLTIRHWKMTGDKKELLRRAPVFAEVEAMIGIIILMAAAALTGQPPAVDVPGQQAMPSEVIHAFAPKVPQLTPPPYKEMLARAQSSLDPYAQPRMLDRIQSDFNHNIAGILVILVGLGALLHQCIKTKWTRHWPLLFLPLALFLLIIGEPTGWPLGTEPFWKTLISPEVFQHRLATMIVVVLGLMEWRVQAGPLSATRWRYGFPILSFIGGALLLTHTHSVFAIKRTFLIEATHNAIGVLAVMLGAAGWMEMRLPGREGRIAGIIWPICLTLVGVVLLFYRET